MPGSFARKERRRKEREGMPSPAAAKAAYVESVDDEGEPRGGAVQQAENKSTDGDDDIPNLVPVREPPKGSQPRLQGPARAPPTSPAKKVQDRHQTNQQQSGNRSKRGPPPRIPRESEPPFGSLGNTNTPVYEEAMNTLAKMTPEDSLLLRNVVLQKMAAEGLFVPSEDPLPKRTQGANYPRSSIVDPPWAPSSRKKDVMTEGEADNLRRAMFEKLDQFWAAPSATAAQEFKPENSPVPQAISGSVDGASHSVEIVTPEKQASIGEQATIVQAQEHEDPQAVEPLLQPDFDDELQALTHAEPISSLEKAMNQNALNDGIFDENSATVENLVDLHAREQPAEASTVENAHPAVDLDNHTLRVARVDNMAKKLRQSVEKARTESRSAQDGITLDRGLAQYSSSSDYASSSGDSGSKPNASQTRRITNDGILELKASPLKVGPARVPSKDHRRKVSLKLPINPPTPQRAYVRPFTQHRHSPSVSTEDSTVAPYEAEERDLEYKHRHIFVGTASLDDFLGILEVTPVFTTAKRQVVKAFGILACAEQVHARQCSNSSDGWNFVTRTTHDDILTHTDYLTEAQVKLGSISLGKFLGKIPFDDKGDVAAIKVVDAFCLASHLDGEATYGPQSKAKAFRSWYVRENALKQDA